MKTQSFFMCVKGNGKPCIDVGSALKNARRKKNTDKNRFGVIQLYNLNKYN